MKVDVVATTVVEANGVVVVVVVIVLAVLEVVAVFDKQLCTLSSLKSDGDKL